MKLTLGQVADWIHAEGDFATGLEAVGYSIDSRTIGAGELFFAVTGERVDGHDYVEAALGNGAVAAVVSQHWLPPDELDACRLLRVPESEDCVLKAMGTLARRVRGAWRELGPGSTGEPRRVIGVTGSAGKTTTKEMVATVLEARFRVLRSEGNLNNHFGMPLQLLKLEPEHEMCVLEMGMNHAGELRALAQIAEPDWAVVTNVAPVHLEHFAEGIAGIAAAKRELVEALPAGGVAVLNMDDERVSEFGLVHGVSPVFYGLGGGVSGDAQIRGQEVEDLGAEGVRFEVELVATEERAEVRLGLLGRHNVSNALAAIAVGVASGIPLRVCAEALGGMRAGNKRGQVVTWRGATLINDSYNSNPRALDAMVDALMRVPATRRIVVAGEMLELGPEGAAMHALCGAHMAAAGVDVVVGVRGLADALVEEAMEEGIAATFFFVTPEEAGGWLRENVREGDAVLVKGSRGVGLERALAGLGGS